MEQQIEEIDLREYLRVILRRKWIIIILFVAAIVSAAVANKMMTPIYEAETTVLIKEQASMEAIPFLAGAMDMGKDARQNYVEILKSRSLALATAQRTGIDLGPEMELLAGFQGSISVQPVQNADVIRIGVQSDDPTQAMLIANNLVQAFIESNRSENQLAARGAKEFIKEQITVVSGELKQAEEALKEFKENERLFSPTEEVSTAIKQVAELETLKAEAQVAAQEAKVRLSEIRGQLKGQEQEVIASTTITNNPLVQSYKAKLAELETQLSTALQTYTTKHPKVVALETEISGVKKQLASELERIVSAQTRTVNPVYQQLLQQLVSLETESTAQQARLESFDEMIHKYDQRFASLPENELRLARLTREKLVAEELYLMLAKRYEEVRITEAMETSDVQIIDPAIVPKDPIKPREKLNIAIAGFLGIFVGIGLVFLLEYMDTSVKSAEDVEALLGLPILAQIPDMEQVGGKRSNDAKGERVKSRKARND